MLARMALLGLSLPTLVTNSKASGGVNTERELLLHRKYPMLHEHHAGNRPIKNKIIFFQERSGLNTQLHRGRQGAERLFTRDFFLFI